MEKRINSLCKRLAFLGYGSFEIDHIMQEASGNTSLNEIQVIATLEKYVELGSFYQQTYSK